MRRYYSLIRLFVLSHMIFTIACNGNNGSDVDNETIKILYEDQNEEAIKAANAFIDFTEAQEDALDTLNSLDPDDPNASEVMEDIAATLEPLADAMEESTSNLISLEEQIQNALENGDVQAQADIVITGTVLIALTAIGVYAVTATDLMKEMNKCFELPTAAEVLPCIIKSWKPGLENAGWDSGKVVVTSVVTAPLSKGKIGLAVKACKVKQTGDKVNTLFGVGEEFVSQQENQDKHMIQYNVPINSMADAPEDDISLVPIYIAQSDGSDDEIFPFIPEGEWSMVAFAPDHEREPIPSVKVSANQTTEVTIDITPIEGCGTTTTTTTTTTITEDVCTIDWYVSYGNEEDLDLSGDYKYPTMHITLPEGTEGPIVSIQVMDELNFILLYSLVGDNIPSTIQYGDYSQPGTSRGEYVDVYPAPALEKDVLYQLEVDVLNGSGPIVGFYINGEICE